MGEARIRKQNGAPVRAKLSPAPQVVPDPDEPTAFLKNILALFKAGMTEMVNGDSAIPLSEFGLLTFSDDNGGTAYLVSDDPTRKKLASFSIFVTDEMRQSKCGHAGCTCKKTDKNNQWNKLLTGCSNSDHVDYDPEYLVPVKLYASLCQNPVCTEQHVWLVSACDDGTTHYNTHAQLR